MSIDIGRKTVGRISCLRIHELEELARDYAGQIRGSISELNLDSMRDERDYKMDDVLLADCRWPSKHRLEQFFRKHHRHLLAAAVRPVDADQFDPEI